jgi:hypothetical protein
MPHLVSRLPCVMRMQNAVGRPEHAVGRLHHTAQHHWRIHELGYRRVLEPGSGHSQPLCHRWRPRLLPRVSRRQQSR